MELELTIERIIEAIILAVVLTVVDYFETPHLGWWILRVFIIRFSVFVFLELVFQKIKAKSKKG